MLAKIKKALKKPDEVINYVFTKTCSNYMSDEMYLKIKYKIRMGKKLNLENPKTFNEKLQWLKLNDRNSLYTKLADKYEVREYIKEKVGEEYLIPLLGVYNTCDEIDFDSLPNQFVLKTTHNSGGVVICRDKNNLNIEDAKKKLNKSLSKNYYNSSREYQYKNIKPRIVCEKYMADKNNTILKDYKFYCFDGKVKVILLVSGRETDISLDFLDEKFNLMQFNKQGYKNSKREITKPINFENMLKIAEQLSNGIPHVRIDLYENNGKIYFGEYTFHDFSGMKKFEPESYDELFGSWIDLTKVSNNKEVDL